MNRDELVDAIIKEVKQVLAMRGVTVAPSVPGQSKGAKSPAASAPAKPVPAAASQAVGSSDLSGKQIVSQRDLEGFAGQTITVRKNAVITPLAYDYAREKGITLNKVDQPSVSGGALAESRAAVNVALVVAPDFPGDCSVVRNFLQSKGFTIKEMTGKSHEAAVNALGTSVTSGNSAFGVCIEKTGMQAPIYANRNKNIRAVHCRETMDARAARVDIGANVVVIDSVSNPEAVLKGFTGG
jgi:hypothetical protein